MASGGPSDLRRKVGQRCSPTKSPHAAKVRAWCNTCSEEIYGKRAFLLFPCGLFGAILLPAKACKEKATRGFQDVTPGKEKCEMQRLVLTIGIVICVGFSVGCQQPAGFSAADRTAIRQADENSVKLMNAKDWKGALADYADDAIEMPSNGPAVQARPPSRPGWRLSRRFPTSRSRIGSRGQN